jgi:hypothetical protein
MSSVTNPIVGQLPQYFGRKYQVQISQPAPQAPAVGIGPPQVVPQPLVTISDSSWEPNALRVVFDIYTPALAGIYWYADVIIYNADLDIINQILAAPVQGLYVTISAGYQNGNYDVIWNGPIFQAFVDRENVTDLKLILYCIVRLNPILNSDGVGDTYSAELTAQKNILLQIAKKTATNLAYVSPNLPTTTLPRAKTIFGNLSNYVDQIAESNNMQWWVNANGINLGGIQEDLTSVNANGDLTFSPPALGAATAGPQPQVPAGAGVIIGVPVQTMYGINFRVLLDPRVQVKKPLMTVKIDNSIIEALRLQQGQNPRFLDPSGVYVVMATRHIGDTRGNPWYTEITGVTRTGNVLSMLLANIANANLNNNSPSQ